MVELLQETLKGLEVGPPRTLAGLTVFPLIGSPTGAPPGGGGSGFYTARVRAFPWSRH